MSDNTNITSKIAKAGAPFKFFGKKESTSPALSTTSKLIPATPKMSFSLKPPVTPTLTDASIKGEMKRTGILEAQLKEVSLTASKAYDQIEDLTLRNNMLEDQVLQQKQLIESFTQQLEDASREKQELKSSQDDALKKKLVEHGQDSDTITRLKSNNSTLHNEIEDLKLKLQRYEQIINEKDTNVQKIQDQHQRELQTSTVQIQKLQSDIQTLTPPTTASSNESQLESHLEPGYKDRTHERNSSFEFASQYKEIINSQQQRITELESRLESRNKQYENTLVEIKSTILVLENNQNFLSKQGYRHFSTPVTEQFPNQSSISDKGEGDTFVLSNLSFLP